VRRAFPNENGPLAHPQRAVSSGAGGRARQLAGNLAEAARSSDRCAAVYSGSLSPKRKTSALMAQRHDHSVLDAVTCLDFSRDEVVKDFPFDPYSPGRRDRRGQQPISAASSLSESGSICLSSSGAAGSCRPLSGEPLPFEAPERVLFDARQTSAKPSRSALTTLGF
jgi:hypothetical protein